MLSTQDGKFADDSMDLDEGPDVVAGHSQTSRRFDPSIAQRGRNIGLDSIRGICATSIAVYHFIAWKGLVLTSVGTFGVYIFFILSALTMFMVYGQTFSTNIARGDLLHFFQNRAARILPLLLVMSAIAAWNYNNEGVLAKAVLTGSGVFSLGLPGHLSASTGAWSLGIEIVFYIAFPVLALMLASVSLRAVVVVTIAAIVAQQVNLSLLPGEAAGVITRWVYYTVPLTFAPFFALGILAHRIKLRASIANFAGAMVGFLIICAYSSVIPFDMFRSSVSYVLLTGISFITVTLAFNSIVPPRLVRWSVLGGELSYSIYLTHWIAYFSVQKVFEHAPKILLPIEFVAFIALTLGISYATYFLIEKPCRDRFRAKR